MKPCYLEFCGINSFSERAEIDFESLVGYGLFGIFGDTGSGKSTILDCIGFALYGNVTRSRSGSTADLVNYRSERAYVNFEFEIVFEGSRRRFRAEREIKRKNAVQSARVYERKGDSLLALSEGVRESNALLERIVGLEQKDFEKCIALPQGEFAQFVRASRSDRLKLVSRLFDLEAYGERLVKRANANYAVCAERVRLAQTRLEPFADVTAEGIETLSREKSVLEEREKKQKLALSALREEEKRIAEAVRLAREARAVRARLDALEAEREEVLSIEGELFRLERALPVVRAAEELEVSRRRGIRAEAELAAAEGRRAEAESVYAAFSGYDEEGAEAEINRLNELRARAQLGENARKKREEAERALVRAREEYVFEAGKYRDFSYEAEKSALEKRAEELGEGDLFSFAERAGKASLFRGEYALFAEELGGISEKYPETAGDVLPLREKYLRLSEGERKSFSDLKKEYEKIERARRENREGLLELEKKNGLYRAHRERLMQLQTEGLRLKGEIEEWSKQVCGESLEGIGRELSAKRAEKRARQDKLERARKAQSEAVAAHSAAAERARSARESLSEAETRLASSLQSGGFGSAEEASALLKSYGDAEQVRARVERFRSEYAAVKARAEELAKADLSADEVTLALHSERLSAAERAYEETVGELARKRDALERGERALAEKRELERAMKETERKALIAERLKKLFEGNRFMDFVAEEYLVNVAGNASARLLSLTDGRYFLRYEGGNVGFAVGDNFNGGGTRGVYTLSGGETFLVSLSLALALSAEICARSLRPIEFFFLDEGFGTLDERLVDTVMDSLEKLRSENFAIGIISHVEELKHRIERKITVEKATERHGSRITVG